jgi:type I restriction enzyme, S subunit
MSSADGVPLGLVAQVVMGQAPPGADCNRDGKGTVFVKAGEFGERQPIVREWTTKPLKRALCGDVLVCVVGATAGKINESMDCAIGRSVAALRPDASKLLPAYLFHFLSSQVTRLRAQSQGLAQGVITREMLQEVVLPLPPVSHQRRIAEILDRADALRAKRRAALAQLDALAQAMFVGHFSGLNLPEWTIGQLLKSGDLSLHKDGNHGSQYPRPDDFGSTGIPFLSAAAIGDDGTIDNALVASLKEDKAAKLRIGWISAGDVLLAHNASVGKVALYDGRFEAALIGTSLTAFRPNPDSLDSLYLTASLRSARFQQQLKQNMGQTTRNQVPITAQRELRILKPSLSLQSEFAAKVVALDRLKAAERSSLAEMKALFASLQYRAFHAEL